MNENAVSHIVILEVLEEGRKQHSAARKVEDDDREAQTRTALTTVPIFYVYMSIANDTYHRAHPDDVFFTKVNHDREYSLIAGRKKAWKTRISMLLETLLEGERLRGNDTVWIGH